MNFRVEKDNKLKVYVNGNICFSACHIFLSEAFDENVQDSEVDDCAEKGICLFDRIESRCFFLKYTITWLLTNCKNLKNNYIHLRLPLKWYLHNMRVLNEFFGPLSGINSFLENTERGESPPKEA